MNIDDFLKQLRDWYTSDKDITIHLPEYVEFKNALTDFIYFNSFEETEEWETILECLPIQLNEYMSGNEANEIIINLEKLKGKLLKEKRSKGISTLEVQQKPAVNTLTSNKKVFIVHGHDDSIKLKVARFLEHLQLTPIILHEQASQGKTVIEKLEEYSDVAFAIILYTSCDIGGKNDTKREMLNKRARQNVVLEHGFLMAKLGRKSVCALHEEDVEIPSDMQGVIYISIDNAEAWKTKLAKEMHANGIEIDGTLLLK